MNELFTHILQALNYAYSGRLVYISGRGFYLRETYRTEDGSLHDTYSSLDGLEQILSLPVESKVYALDDLKSVSELVRSVGGATSQQGRIASGAWTIPYSYVYDDFDLNENEQKIAERYGIEDLSDGFDKDFMKLILKELRKLTVEAIKKSQTNRRSTTKIKQIYSEIRHYAEKNDFSALQDKKEELLRIIGRLVAAQNGTLIRETKKSILPLVVRQLKIWTTVVVFFTAIGVGASYYLSHKSNNKRIDAGKEQVFNQKEKTNQPLTRKRISQAIAEHNRTSKHKIYRWRAEKITSYLLSHYTTLSEAELRKAIDTMTTTAYPFWLEH